MELLILISIIAQLGASFGFPMEMSQEETGGYFEGDMELSLEQTKLLKGISKAGMLSDRWKWPRSRNGSVLVPFVIQDNALYTNSQIRVIEKAMNEIESRTCVRFVRRRAETSFIEIHSGQGCSASVGRQGTRQSLSLSNPTCVHHGIVVHELLHALGFFHMQSSHDRDDHVRILFDNIIPGTEHNFRKYASTVVSNYQTHYDLDSVLHYGAYFFSANGRPTIETLNPSDMHRIGQRRGLSSGDIQRVRNMYCN